VPAHQVCCLGNQRPGACVCGLNRDGRWKVEKIVREGLPIWAEAKFYGGTGGGGGLPPGGLV